MLIFIIALIFIPRLGSGREKTYALIGLIWLVLTICFETIFGLINGKSLSELVKAYDITTNNLWLIVVLFVGIVPWLTAKIKRIT